MFSAQWVWQDKNSLPISIWCELTISQVYKDCPLCTYWHCRQLSFVAALSKPSPLMSKFPVHTVARPSSADRWMLSNILTPCYVGDKYISEQPAITNLTWVGFLSIFQPTHAMCMVAPMHYFLSVCLWEKFRLEENFCSNAYSKSLQASKITSLHIKRAYTNTGLHNLRIFWLICLICIISTLLLCFISTLCRDNSALHG